MKITQRQIKENESNITIFDITGAYLILKNNSIEITYYYNINYIALCNAKLYIRPDSISIIDINGQVIFYTNKKMNITIMNNLQ